MDFSSSTDSTDIVEPLPLIGWREWVRFPQLELPYIKAKVDTGAASSSLHALNVEFFDRLDEPWVAFQVHPHQRDDETTIDVECPLLEIRRVKSSSGHVTDRPVIGTKVKMGRKIWSIQLTLINRKMMGFRMLLGREALRNRYSVDVSHSFLHRPKKKRRR